MEVSIIIPTRNRNLILIETLNSIAKTDAKLINNIEVILVNDGDDELSIPKTIIDQLNIIIIKSNSKGAAFARNMGAQSSKGKLLLFLDDDILIPEDNIIKHLKVHDTYVNSIVSGIWKYSDEVLRMFQKTSFGKYKVKHDYKSHDGTNGIEISTGIFKVQSLASFNLSISRSVFFDIKGFNEEFLYAGCEDQEFTGRALNAGYNLLLDTNNISFHNEKDRIHIEKWLARQYTGVQGFVLLAELFPQRKQTAMYCENTPIYCKDSLRLKSKKTAKYLLSRTGITWLIIKFTLIGEKLYVPNFLLFKMYNLLAGIYLYKGFMKSYRNLGLKIDAKKI